jgi:hypothetical protein
MPNGIENVASSQFMNECCQADGRVSLTPKCDVDDSADHPSLE